MPTAVRHHSGTVGSLVAWHSGLPSQQRRLLHVSLVLAAIAASVAVLLASRQHSTLGKLLARPLRKPLRKPCERCWCGDPEDEADAKYGSQYFAICIAVKDQHADIREWVAHHAAVGAGKIYMFDTGSNPPLNETLPDHIDSGLVDHIWWPPDFGTSKKRRFPQNVIYKECMERYWRWHQFIGFIDADEFLIMKGGYRTVPQLLKRMQAFEVIGGLGVNWVVFGSSGHKTRPEMGVLQAYTKCLPANSTHSTHIKSIVNTEHYLRPEGPHNWWYEDGYFAVNERFARVDGPKSAPVSTDKIALHHYVLKSEEEYREKMARGSAMGNHKPFSFFQGIDRLAELVCDDAVQYGPYP